MRRRSERKKSSSPAPVPVAVARRSRRSRKVSENEKTEDEAPVAGQKDIPDTDVPELPQASVAREEINEARASSEERAGSGSSPVRKSRGSRTTPKKRTEAKGGDKKVDTIPEEEPENGPGVKKLNSDAVQQNVSPQVAPRKKAPKPPVTSCSSNTVLEAGAAGPSPSPVIVSGPLECIVCNEILQLVRFEPCQHQIACEECGIRMKKCLRCGVVIERRLTASGRIVALPTSTSSPSDPTRLPSGDLLRYLENKVQEFEESHFCGICMERKRDVAFLCGHGACSHCAETLRTCHMCRKTILKKINLY